MPTTNKVKYGLSNVYYAKLSNGTYSTPVKIEGAVSISIKPEGASTNFYADNVIYWTKVTNNGYSGSLELGLVPDSFKTDILGETKDATSGVITEDSSVQPSDFALMFEFEGDVAGRRHVLYQCTASRPKIESETTSEKGDIKAESFDITCKPMNVSASPLYRKVKASVELSGTNATVYDGFFESVYGSVAG